MILTIGMIMKNEERFLRDCLTAIKPILDNVDSELIIHDTGSTDNSIAIAKEFTDNVFEIEWRDDFGWARQQGFERAKGEWFFVLACDEIFEDVQEIIDFFNSGEYKNYGNAAVKIKNVTYGKIEPTYLSKPNSMRLYKIVEGMKWKGKIHEQLLPYAEPTKMLNSVFLHYGYLNEVVVEKNKSDKYLSMMLKAHEENLLDYQVIYFLAQSHQRLPKVALQYAQKALKLSKQTELDENYPHSLTIYPQSVRLVAHMCTKLGEHQKAIECIQEYFDTVPKQKITDIAYVLKIEQSILYEQESNFVESNKAALLAYEYKKLSDNNQLPVALGIAVDQIEEYVFITQILKTFILANLFIDAIEWLQNLLTVEDCKVDKYECYSNFFDLIAVHNPILLGDLHLYFVNKYNPSDKEYNDITALILMKSDSSNQATKTNLANIILQKNNNESQFVMFQRIQLNID
ncbi:MAG: glycosyltransferase family 2 protein, partial [Firmicutes bacterium]|nr:glycosyltransferase family 2 protein [Bacillota bacterium]